MLRHFLTLSDISQDEYPWVFERARFLKTARAGRADVRTLTGYTLALLFEKVSTRTLVSFDAAMAQLGGHPIVLSQSSSQLSRGEPIADTARALSGYVDGIMMRTSGHNRLAELAKWSSVPVLNGLTNSAHPAQLLADLLTVIERFGSLAGRKIAFVGDGATNMALSWIEAASLFDFELTIATPPAYVPDATYVSAHPARLQIVHDPITAAKGAEVVNTDVWTSMGQEEETAARRRDFANYQVNAALMKHAAPEAIVLHCLPAHRGEEIAEEVLEGKQSAVWQQAENRMHAQKALLELFLLPVRPHVNAKERS